MKGTFATRPGQEIFNPYSHDSLLVNCCSVVCGPLPPRSLSAILYMHNCTNCTYCNSAMKYLQKL